MPPILSLLPTIYVPEELLNTESLGEQLWEATSLSHINKIYFYALNYIKKGKWAAVEEYTGCGKHQIYRI